MATNHEIRELLEATAYDADGEKLGKVNEVYINDTSGQPDFIEVNHGLFGLGSSLVPLRGHDLNGEELRLAFPKDRIKDAPNVDADAHLSNEEQENLYRHYGLDRAENRTSYTDHRRNAGVAGAGAGVAGAGVAGADREREVETERRVEADRHAAADRDVHTNNDGEIIRSEERLNVNKERVGAGEVKLRKYVVNETETVEVPVQREEVSVERTPISADEAANYNGRIGEEEASVTLHEERVNVSKETVPVEKVNLNKETVQDTERVSETVAKERIDTTGTEDIERKK
ncbi:PRC and DUF2382 domain-containing protein [Corynebacterium tapiri]|uniref:DUF2382 domain-containing protein n=1 Tax=Corynebacterium tapiri TaxID=1448266 RepID=A0A5C4U315_9CORY|nr:PRC and DUF2382 domain-containing protein [Corynebacterium tapiri]TNL95737.1 DUF2382 domain-containing protein [Corynebacterium tapiri]